MQSLELKVPPLAVILIALALVYVLAKLPLPQYHFAWTDAVSGLFLLTGAISAFLGLWQFRQARTTTNPLNPSKASNLVTSGIYRFTRNPMYLGMLFVLIGGIIEFGALLGFVIIPLFVWYMTRFQIVPEEQIIEGLFGQDYRDYKQQVRRWI
jgi:protein-S-isoprenylcysteine O-methyltransferase Ste14